MTGTLRAVPICCRSSCRSSVDALPSRYTPTTLVRPMLHNDGDCARAIDRAFGGLEMSDV